MCVGYTSTLTPNAVIFPPKPPGPISSLLIFSNNSFSKSATYEISLCVFKSLVNAFLAKIAHFSNVPPTPTPTTTGGHAFGPAILTVSITAFLTPSIPSAGLSIHTRLMFSLPNPFGATVISIFSPAMIS